MVFSTRVLDEIFVIDISLYTAINVLNVKKNKVEGEEQSSSSFSEGDAPTLTVADPGFPVGGRGRGPLTRALFGENVCTNERIGSHRGPCTWHTPSRSTSD